MHPPEPRNGASPPSATHAGFQSDGRAYVTLTEALTWIAFGQALSLANMRVWVEGQRLHDPRSADERLRAFFADTGFDNPERSDQEHRRDLELSGMLGEACRKLRVRVDKGLIRLRGRFSQSFSLEEARLADAVFLTGDMLATFSQFDVSTGGLRRQPLGSPDVLWPSDPNAFDREFEAVAGDPRAGEGYLLVEVEAVGLFADANVALMGRAPSFKSGRPPSDAEILAKADEMKALGMTGRSMEKVIRLEPGFENVGAQHFRELIKGRWERSGRPRKKSA